MLDDILAWNLQTISARTVPSGSMAEVYSRAKGKVTFVKVFAGNLSVNKSIYQHTLSDHASFDPLDVGERTSTETDDAMPDEKRSRN